MFNFALLPNHIIYEILELCEEERMKLLLLNHDIYHILIPLIYNKYEIVNCDNFRVNFQKYGRYINALSISFDEHSSKFHNEFGLSDSIYNKNHCDPYEKLIDEISKYLNPECYLNLKVTSYFNHKHIDILSKFQISKFTYQLEYGYQCLEYKQVMKLINTNNVSVIINSYLSQEFLNDLSININKLIINSAIRDQSIFNIIIGFKQLNHLKLNLYNIRLVDLVFREFYPNLSVLIIEYSGMSIPSNVYEVDGNKFPRLKTISLKVSFEVNFINTFEQLKSAQLDKTVHDNFSQFTVIPESDILVFLSLGLSSFITENELLHIANPPNNTNLRTFNPFFLNLTYLVIRFEELSLKSLELLLKPPNLKTLSLIWASVSVDLFYWLTSPPRWNLQLEYIKLYGVSPCPYLAKFLISSSPHLIAVKGKKWVEKCCNNLNIPFKC